MDTDTMRTYTLADFRLYRQHVDHWLKQFGMTEWHVNFKHVQCGEGTCAEVNYDNRAKTALFKLTKQVDGELGYSDAPAYLALHEVLHLLLADYSWTSATAKDDVAEIVVSHEHEIINRLIRVITKGKQ